MDNFWNFWNSLTQGFRENLAAQIIGGLIATLLAGGITFFIARLFVKKELPSIPSPPSPQQTQQQQIIVNVPPAQIVQAPPVVASEPLPRGDTVETLHATSLQSTPIPRPPQYGFVAGYDDEGNDLVARVSELLNQNRAVALIGSGGLGKTTLAAEIARACLPSPSRRGAGGEVVWTTADGRTDFSLGTLLDEAATQLGNPDVRTLALEQKSNAVRGLLAGRVETLHATSLLVIDNFETIAAEQQKAIANFINTLSCAVLITSRVAVDGAERVNIGAMSPEEAQDFLTRWIASSKKKNALTPLIDEIANLAERNPMVMRWIVGQLERAQRMSDVLDELSRGQGDAATRVFGRSFGLLNEDGKATLLSLALFVPSANRAALAFTAGFGDDIQRLNDALMPLADLQLVETDANNECLSVVGLTRRFTNAQLDKDAKRAKYRKRFVDYFVNYAERHAETTPEDLDVLEGERENLLAAMDVAFATKDWQIVVRITRVVARINGFLDLRGYWDEAIKRNEQARDVAQIMHDEHRKAVYIQRIGIIRQHRGEYTEAQIANEQALTIYRKLHSENNIAVALHQLGNIAFLQGDYELARTRYAESFEIDRKLGDQDGVARSLHQLGMIAQQQSDDKTALAHFSECMEIDKKLGNQHGISQTLHQLGNIAFLQNDYETARVRYAESLEIKRKLGDQDGIALSVGQMGLLAERQGNTSEAAHLFNEALEIWERLKSPNAKYAHEMLARVIKKKKRFGLF